jgi:hypothetical protein
MILKNEIKRRNFFGYILGGIASGFFISNPTRLVASAKKIFKTEKKIVVKQNPLAVPRKKENSL